MHNTRMICIWIHISKNIPFHFKHHVFCIFKASITSHAWPIQNKEGICTFCQQVYVCKNIRTFILRKFFKVFLDHNICYLRMLLHLYIYFSNNKVIILFVCEKLCTNKTEPKACYQIKLNQCLMSINYIQLSNKTADLRTKLRVNIMKKSYFASMKV